MIELARKVAESEFTSVMILGEPGTGKGALAKAIHETSERRSAPFIEVNCGAIPRNLLESEFFGYEKGAATYSATPRSASSSSSSTPERSDA